MPCRKENYIFLEQSVTVDSKEVDALVTKIGEALQLHNNSAATQKTMSCLIASSGSSNNGSSNTNVNKQTSVNNGAPSLLQNKRNNGCCMRLRTTGGRGRSSRASPYNMPMPVGSGHGDQETSSWVHHIKPWNKKRGINVEEDDPHRLLQDLILSGNLIKEAVRRLQFSAADCGDFSNNAADNVQPC